MDYAADWETLTKSQDVRVPPDVQASRDATASRIRQDEGGKPTLASWTPDMLKQAGNDYASDWDNLPTKVSKVPQTAQIQATQAPSAPSQPGTVEKALLAAMPAPLRPAYDLARQSGIVEGTTETVKAVGSGIGGGILAGLHGAYKALAPDWAGGGSMEDAANAVRSTQEALTYQPKGEGARKAVELIGSNWNPLNWPMAAGRKIAGYGVDKGLLSPGEAAGIEAASGLVTPGMILKGAGLLKSKLASNVEDALSAKPFGSVGASAVSTGASIKTAAANASPELKQAIMKVKPENLNTAAAELQLKADSLPVPMKLTAGQATKNGTLISWEQNNRAREPVLHQVLSEQSPQLHENLRAIRDDVAPDVFSVKPVENAETIIKGYQATDAALRADISAKYKALEAANGGKFPINGRAFVATADEALAKALRTDYVPAPLEKMLNRFREGEQMTFEQFETLRTNLAKDMRSPDGITRHVAGIVRDALESLPLEGNAAALKPMADAARKAAKTRFDLLEKDPAYKASVNDVAPDRFIQKFIISAPARDVQTMINHLGADSVERQAAAAGVINYLREQAGTEANNFSQAGFNKALRGLDTKLPTLVGNKAYTQLNNIGEVAHATTFQPRGSWVNNSNTWVSQAAEHVKGALEYATNKVTLGIGGTAVRNAAQRHASGKIVQKAVEPGAGISLKDIGK